MTQEELEILLKELDEQITKNRTTYLEKNDYLKDLKKSYEADFVEENAKFQFEMTFDDDSGTWEIDGSYYDSDNGGICYTCWLDEVGNRCKIFIESEIENLINKPVVKISLEKLKQKKEEIFDKISKEEQACHKVCEELRREYTDFEYDYIEQNKLYQNGFKFIDKHGDSREIVLPLLNQYCEIEYLLAGWGFADEIYAETEITNFLNKHKQ